MHPEWELPVQLHVGVLSGAQWDYMGRRCVHYSHLLHVGDPSALQMSRRPASFCRNVLFGRIVRLGFVTVTILMNISSVSRLLATFCVLLG